MPLRRLIHSSVRPIDAKWSLSIVRPGFAVAMSPGVDYRNIKPEGAVAQLGTRPLLAEAARDDARSAAAVEEFAKLNPNITAKVWSAGGHGNSILEAHPEELDRIIELLASHLR